MGLTAFVLFGGVAGAIALDFVSARPNPTYGLFAEISAFLDSFDGLQRLDVAPAQYLPWHRVALIAFAGSLAGGLAETLRARLDDNFRVALAAGAVLFLLDPLKGLTLAPVAG
jgi:hypothetical protein